jgi:hypothetical protein
MQKVNNSTALRCIGQDLLLRGIKTFEICNEGNRYIVQGGYQPPPAPMPVTIQYTLSDIVELDGLGEEKRGTSRPPKDFLNVSQILRTIGGYLDKNEARLVRLANGNSTSSEPLFRVEYYNREGERIVDDRAGSAIYDMCVVMYKQRGRMTGTDGRFPRKRR